MTPRQIADALMQTRAYSLADLSPAFRQDIHTMIVDGIERALAEAATDWEYGVDIEGVRYGASFKSFQQHFGYLDHAQESAARLRLQVDLPDWQPNITRATVVRRRKAGEWEPVS